MVDSCHKCSVFLLARNDKLGAKSAHGCIQQVEQVDIRTFWAQVHMSFKSAFLSATFSITVIGVRTKATALQFDKNGLIGRWLRGGGSAAVNLCPLLLQQ